MHRQAVVIVAAVFSGSVHVTSDHMIVRWGLFARHFNWNQAQSWHLDSDALRFELHSHQLITGSWRDRELFDSRENAGSMTRQLQALEPPDRWQDPTPVAPTMLWSRLLLTLGLIGLLAVSDVIGQATR